MKKIKQISREQYLALAQLGMPVKASHFTIDDSTEDSTKRGLIGIMSHPLMQEHEHRNYESFASRFKVFYTLVDSSDEA